MRAITGAVVSSKPCSLKEAYIFIQDYCRTPDSYLRNSDCGTYVVTLIPAIREQHLFSRRCGPAAEQQQGDAYLDAHGYQGVVEEERWQQGGEMDWETEVPVGGPHGSVEEEKVKHSDKQLVGVKQEPDLITEEDLGSQMKKGNKEKEKVYVVKLEEDVVEVKAQVVNNGVADEGITDGEMKRKKKKHTEKEHHSKGVKEEEKMPTDCDLNSEKKKEKKKRGGRDDEVKEQGEHNKKKKQRKESQE